VIATISATTEYAAICPVEAFARLGPSPIPPLMMASMITVRPSQMCAYDQALRIPVR